MADSKKIFVWAEAAFPDVGLYSSKSPHVFYLEKSPQKSWPLTFQSKRR